MYKDNLLYVAHSAEGPIHLIGRMANRHGLIAGATGTGKTVTMQVLAETFSEAGVPCFMADMKGDLAGIACPGKPTSLITERAKAWGMNPDNLNYQGCPVRLYDVWGKQGHPIRITIEQIGPALMGRLMELNDTQTDVLTMACRIAKDEQWALTDLKDLRAILEYMAQNATRYARTYGNIQTATIGAIQRALLALEEQGADKLFGEPAFDIADMIQNENGRGVMNILAADKLMLSPKLYSTLLMWMLTEIYERMPETGDQDLPKMILFFDEAHMLFKDTSKALTDKIEQVVRLIRSKGIGVYFITQSASDIPEAIAGQCGNRIQHALRAYTPKDKATVKATAQTFRPNPQFDTEREILQLGTGEALVSLLDEKGAPAMVQRAKILFPLSRIGAITADERLAIIASSPLGEKYRKAIDRDSAFEHISRIRQEAEKQAAQEEARTIKEKERKTKQKSGGKSKNILTTVLATAITYFAKTVATQLARNLTKKSKKK